MITILGVPAIEIHASSLVIDNTNIMDCYKSFNILFFKEAMKINEKKPTLNTGLKASKELQLF